MNREIHGHEINECNQQIEISADEKGNGGASHHYQFHILGGKRGLSMQSIQFQDGAIKEVGVNGITHEALLTVIKDRLICFQEGPYACPENETALKLVNDTLAVLHKRTKLRDERGVEGTHEI